MPSYAWRCRTCGTELRLEAKYWPVIEEAHRLFHGLEDRLRELLPGLKPVPGVVLEVHGGV